VPAKTFAEALDAIGNAAGNSHPLAAVLIDADALKQQTFTILQQLSEQEHPARSIIAMVSPTTASEFRKQLHHSGVTAILVKPFLADKLDEALRGTNEKSPPKGTNDTHEETNYPGMHVLVTEDNPVNLMLITQLLKVRGITVDSAQDGISALEKLKKQPFDMVFMDIQMPGLDGMEVTRQVRQLEEDSGMHVPIIALTAHAMVGDRERFLQAGMDAHLAKPIDVHELNDIIERFAPASLSHA
jgi:CheY-like chemotaxis protein